MAGDRLKCTGRTVDGLYISLVGQRGDIIDDMGKESLHFEFVGECLFAFAAAEAGDAAVFALFQRLFRGVAEDVDLAVRRDQLDDSTGAGGNAGSAADTKLLVDDRQIIDDFDRTERTLCRTAAHTDAAVTAALWTACDQRGGTCFLRIQGLLL